MKSKNLERLARSMPKTTSNMSEYPGYRYEFYTSFDELDLDFKQQFGDAWASEPWARVWLGRTRVTTVKHKKRLPLKNIIRDVYTTYGYQLPFRRVHAKVLEMGYKAHFESIRRFCKQILEEKYATL